MSTGKLTLVVRILPDGPPMTIIGRDAWTLKSLLNAGTQGCTPIDNPAPRWSHYVFKLRGFGFVIETVTEKHGGAFAGTHARYVLHSQVEIVRDSQARAA